MLPRTTCSTSSKQVVTCFPCFKKHLEEALPCQFDLARGIGGFEPAPGNARLLALAELKLILVGVPRAGAVVREVHTR